MEFKEIVELVKLINKSNLTEFKIKDGEFQLSIRTKKYGKQKAPQILSTPQQQMVPVQASIPTIQVPASNVAPSPAPAAAVSEPKEPPAEKPSENTTNIKSPIVGTFYRSPSPDKPPYLKVGDRVEVGQVVCIVEAMKLFNEIESEVSGKVLEILIDDASPVEYDQPLFKIDPNG